MPNKRCHKCRKDIPDAEWKRHQRAHSDLNSRANGYRLTAWKRTSQAVLEAYPVCQRCQERPSVLAHHKHGMRPVDPGGLNPRNCVGLCTSCHQLVHNGAPLFA
jgi:hypothetical protein